MKKNCCSSHKGRNPMSSTYHQVTSTAALSLSPLSKHWGGQEKRLTGIHQEVILTTCFLKPFLPGSSGTFGECSPRVKVSLWRWIHSEGPIACLFPKLLFHQPFNPVSSKSLSI